MPKKATNKIACEFYVWNLFIRDGVFYADGRMNSPKIGKHSLGTRDRDQALQNLRKLDRRMAIEQKLMHTAPKDGNVELAISEGWERYLNYCNRPNVTGGVSDATRKRYRAVRDKHLLFCTEHKIGTWIQINKKSAEAYAAWLQKKGRSNATIYLEITLIKQLVKWLIEEERILPDANRIRLKLARSHESDSYCYRPEEVRAMVDVCLSQPKIAWLSQLIIALALTGMRISEALALRWSDIDLVSDIITLHDNRHSGRHLHGGEIRTTKGRRGRRIPIHFALHQVIEAMPRNPDGFVFAGPKRGRLKADVIRNIFIRDVLKSLKSKFPTPRGEIGFEHGRLHSFRHFFISQAFLGGASEGEIRSWVGHRDSRIIERYRHLRSDDARRKMDRIEFFQLTPDQIANDSRLKHSSVGIGDESKVDRAIGAPDGPDRRQRNTHSEVPASRDDRGDNPAKAEVA
jgi:integrase